METITQFLKVADVLDYREFDRLTEPAPFAPFVNTYSLESVIGWVQENGLKEPLKLSIFESKALVTDGNHRLLAAAILGLKEVEFDITFFESFEELSATFEATTIARFKTVC